jgi:hypothetical protein
MTNALKVLLQMQSGFLQLESTLGISAFVTVLLACVANAQ